MRCRSLRLLFLAFADDDHLRYALLSPACPPRYQHPRFALPAPRWSASTDEHPQASGRRCSAQQGSSTTRGHVDRSSSHVGVRACLLRPLRSRLTVVAQARQRSRRSPRIRLPSAVTLRLVTLQVERQRALLGPSSRSRFGRQGLRRRWTTLVVLLGLISARWYRFGHGRHFRRR